MTKTYPKGSSELVSKDFQAKEFDCQCRHSSCQVTFIDEDLIDRLQLLRDVLGCPITITSGFRCVEHQLDLQIKGYETPKVSQHEFGRAVDITIGKDSGEFLEGAARRAGFRSVGVASNWIHVDLRPETRRWTYQKRTR